MGKLEFRTLHARFRFNPGVESSEICGCLGCGCSCPLCCVTITAVCVWGDMSSGCNAPRRFQPTTVWVQGAPTSRINQALELSVPIKQPCPSNRHAAGYRRSAHPQLQLNLLFWDAPSLRLPCWPTTTTTSYCAGTYLVPGGGRSLLCQPAGTAGPDHKSVKKKIRGRLDFGRRGEGGGNGGIIGHRCVPLKGELKSV